MEQTYTIFRKNADPVIDFAAQELKKYLRMMMPRCGEIHTPYYPSARPEDGFCLGVFTDFGINPCPVEDARLDDAVYAETTASGGVIAGSNPRSVLLSVYRYLRENGCRWLFPGPDGEVIPVKEIKPVSFCKAADCRYRGQCNEGSETQSIMFDAIDFTPKIGMNTFMQEFDIPHAYYDLYYRNEGALEPDFCPEQLSDDTIQQWKRACEAEIAKRGLLYHDMGHGWTAAPFGLPNNGGWDSYDDEKVVPAESRQYLALRNGKRELYNGVPLNTNICMSNPAARAVVAKAVADYAEKQNNVDFLHIWLADASNNHCECAACAEKSVPDWYVMLLNDIDRELTARGLDTHIVFIVYVDTVWAPAEEQLQNPARFSMLFAPITRRYTETYRQEPDFSALTPFVRNRLSFPHGMAAYLAYLSEWQKRFSGDCFCYEYHFWVKQYHDLGGMYHARIISEDIKGLKRHRLRGMVEDGSQRSAFPTGFPAYVYGLTLFDNNYTYEELRTEYFSAAFGEDWRAAADYLDALSDSSVISLLYGELPRDSGEAADAKAKLFSFRKTVRAFLPFIDEHRNHPVHACAVSWRLLYLHAETVLRFLDACEETAAQHPEQAKEHMEALREKLWLYDLRYPGCCDSALLYRTLESMIEVL